MGPIDQDFSDDTSGIAELAAAARSGDRSVRPALLRALADLFASRPEPGQDEILRFQDMALHLIPQADPASLAHVASRLARHPASPMPVLRRLMQADIVSATILIDHCMQIHNGMFEEIARAEAVAPAVALARRPGLQPHLAALLSQRTEPDVLRALAANTEVVLNGDILDRLMKAGRTDPELGARLCERIGDSETIAPLYVHASRQQRLRILTDANNALASGEEILAARLFEPEAIEKLVGLARTREWNAAASLLARQTGIPIAAIRDMMRDATGEPFALLLAATGVPREQAVLVFLRMHENISHSCERIEALAGIMDTMSAHAARRVALQIAGTAETRKTPVHVPLHDPAAAQVPGRPAAGAGRPREGMSPSNLAPMTASERPIRQAR